MNVMLIGRWQSIYLIIARPSERRFFEKILKTNLKFNKERVTKKIVLKFMCQYYDSFIEYKLRQVFFLTIIIFTVSRLSLDFLLDFITGSFH